MRYDCGTLALNPRQSPIFRMIHDRVPPYSRSHGWPDTFQQEMCVLLHTPGFSKAWIEHQFGMNTNHTDDMKKSLAGRWPEWTTKGKENLLTATYDDALRYIQRGPARIKMPFWVVPFYLEDKRRGVGWSELIRRWGYREYAIKFDFSRLTSTF